MIRTLAFASLLMLPLTALADEPHCKFNAPRDLKLDVAGAKAVVFEVNQHDLVLQADRGAPSSAAAPVPPTPTGCPS